MVSCFSELGRLDCVSVSTLVAIYSIMEGSFFVLFDSYCHVEISQTMRPVRVCKVLLESHNVEGALRWFHMP